MFEEQIKMFDENKQQLYSPFPVAHRVIWESFINPYCSPTHEQMAFGGHVDGQEIISLLS